MIGRWGGWYEASHGEAAWSPVNLSRTEALGFAVDRRGTSSCLAKKKYPRRSRARCVARLRRVLCAARSAGYPRSTSSRCVASLRARLRNSGLRPSDSARRLPPGRPVLLDDAEGMTSTDRSFRRARLCSGGVRVFPPWSAEQRRRAGGSSVGRISRRRCEASTPGVRYPTEDRRSLSEEVQSRHNVRANHRLSEGAALLRSTRLENSLTTVCSLARRFASDVPIIPP